MHWSRFNWLIVRFAPIATKLLHGSDTPLSAIYR
jgi:hypothetical protein